MKINNIINSNFIKLCLILLLILFTKNLYSNNLQLKIIGNKNLELVQELSSPWTIRTIQKAAIRWPKTELIFVADIAKESVSAEKVVFAPNFNATKDRIPLPQPMSAIVWPTGGLSSKASIHNLVEG